MPRISYVEPHTASTEVQQLYEHRLGGKPGNVHKIMAHKPKALTAFLAFYATTGRSLDRKLYELVYIRVSMLNQCHYCLQHHLASSKRIGVTPEDWQALKSGDFTRFTDAERDALKFAEKLTKTPWEIIPSDIETLKRHLSEAQIVDLDLLVGLANLTNRFTDPLGAELETTAEKI